MSQYPIYKSLEEACQALGVEVTDVPRDDRPHPVPLSDGSSKTDGRIRLFTNNDGGWVQNWRLGSDKALFFPDYGKTLTPEERKQKNAELEKAKQEAREKTRWAFSKAKQKIMKIYQAGRMAAASNPYLQRKGVKPKGIIKALNLNELEELAGYSLFGGKGKFADGEILIIPRGNNKEGITTLELIDQNGNKTYFKNGKLAGAYWLTNKIPAPGVNQTIGICEGVATALSIHQSAGISAVSVGGCTNFENCTAEIKERYPEARLIILGDVGNGEKAARECARKFSISLCIPAFSEAHRKRFKELNGNDKEPTDFNDLEQISSKEITP